MQNCSLRPLAASWGMLLFDSAFGVKESSSVLFPVLHMVARMRQMSWNKCALVVFLLGGGVALLAAENKRTTAPSDETEAALMRAKLASSQKMVEGLMTQDFRLVENGAQELEKICRATQWHAEEDQVYAHYRGELARTAKKLAELARDGDQDGAMYTFMHSVTTCMGCHDYCRDVLHVAQEDPKLQAIPSYEADQESAATTIRH